MSFVIDQVRRIDGQLDRLQLANLPGGDQWYNFKISQEEANDVNFTSRVEELQYLVKNISTTNNPPLQPQARIQSILHQARISSTCRTCQQHGTEGDYLAVSQGSELSYEHELEWMLLSKVTAQTYGLVLNTLLDQTIPLSNDIWYWDDVLSSYRYTGLYSIQTSPLRFWDWSKDIYHEVSTRRQQVVTEGWNQFYTLVKDVVRERSMADIQRRVVSPIGLVRTEARRKQAMLKKIRRVNANALGVLLGEGLSNESLHEDGLLTPQDQESAQLGQHKWKHTVAKNIALMDLVLQKVSDYTVSVDKFDAAIAEMTHDDPYYELETGAAISLKPSVVADRLDKILSFRLQKFQEASAQQSKEHGKPSRLVRYWLPVTVAILSSSTVLRIAVKRKAEILTWIREFGATCIDFWSNWVVEPTKKVIGTIRHDEASEVSIMSKRSLEGDRDSLERMVVDFAVDSHEGLRPTEAEILDIRNKVREGDLTPVLKAYEKDLQKPFVGAVRGNLVRALLIQIQKTKVDVEVAMGGIDSLLKSQELVFGFIGLTPGLLVCIGAWRWLSGVFGSRKSNKHGKKQGQTIRVLRNIDRILTSSTRTEYGELFYKDHGLLLCEVHVLRQSARRVLPTDTFRDFIEEIDELVDIRTGVERQEKVVHRMRWAYAKWF